MFVTLRRDWRKECSNTPKARTPKARTPKARTPKARTPKTSSVAPVLKWHAAGAGAGAAGRKADGPVTFVLSTDDVDRHGDVVSADGWRLEAYLRNPVLLWAHDYRHPAIGRAVEVWTEPHRLLASMEFAPSPFAQDVAALYAGGFQWAVSVGFRPIRWEERRDARTGALLGLRYLEQELLEVSAVPVPANRSALRRDATAAGDPLNNPAASDSPGAAITWSEVALGALLAELESARR